VLNLFEKCDDLTFNCFEAEKLARGEEMSFLMIYLFEKNDLFTNLNINPKTFTDFAKALQNGYKNNPYHRKLHAFDVM
jgi:3',5'-cyclic-nucleotide phosphodiesterase/cAMP-specific phosphodiesterase 4/calcium/calmodulin-dependent 3',5'-cyclic nucleotide phosphodiesterase